VTSDEEQAHQNAFLTEQRFQSCCTSLENYLDRSLVRRSLVRLSADMLDLVPQRCKRVRHTLAMVALNLELAIFDCAARAALLFEGLEQLLQRSGIVSQAADNSHRLACAAFAVACYARCLLARRGECRGWLGWPG